MACISITSPGKPLAALSPGWAALLRTAFFDIGPEALGQNPFTRKQALQVLHFLDVLPDSVTHLVVHCHAGISRSPAIARYVAQRYGLAFPKNHTTFNRWVYQLLLDVT